MSQSPEHASLSPVAFDRDGLRLSVEPEPVRSTSRPPIPPPKTPTPPQSLTNVSVVEPLRPSLAVLIIKPHAIKQRLKIEKRIVEAGFEIEKERKMGFHIESHGIVEMFGPDAPSLSGEPVWVYVLSRPRASSALTALAGPVDPLAARKSDPDSLRALYGSNRWENGVWITRDETNADRVIGELFAGSPIMDFSDLPSVGGSPDRRKVRKSASHTSSIRSDFTGSVASRAKVATPSVSGASLKVPTPTKAKPAPGTSPTAKPGFKARPVPATISNPSIVPRTTRAADLRAGGAAAAAAIISPPRQRQSQEERERTFEGVPGHKRRESISVASTAPPAIAPRVNRSAQLRAQKLAEAADPSVKAARRQSMIDFPSAKERQLSPEAIEERNRATFEGVPGHKRRESITVASTAPPAVAPRVNRSSMLRAQKMAAAAAGGSGGPPSSFKGAPATENSPAGGPARSLSARSSRTSISGPPSGTIGRSSVSGTQAILKTSVNETEKPTGGALTPISNGAKTSRSTTTPAVVSKPDIVPRTNKSALLRAAAKLKSAATGGAGSVGGQGLRTSSGLPPARARMDKRPLSAIFLGSSAAGASAFRTPTALQVATGNTSSFGGSGLPSPPATNSTASTGKESVPKRVRKTSLAFATVKSLLSGDKREQERARMRREDDVDDQPFEDEDHTARLSGGPTASTSSGGSLILGRSHSTTSSGGMDRKSLADRNRKVLDKLSSISSAASSRLNSPAPVDRVPLTASTLKSRGLSPMPPVSNNTLFPPKSNTSASGSSPRGGPIPLASPNVRQARDLESETPSPASRLSSADSNSTSSGKGSDHQRRASAVVRQTSSKDSPRVRDIEFKTHPEESTTPKERDRLYESQRAPAPVFSVGGEGSASGIRKEGSVRVSFSRSRQDVDLGEVVGNGNGHAPRQRVYSSESDDRSVTPPADPYSRRHVTDPVPPTTPGLRREQRISIVESSPTKEREPLKTRTAAGTVGRQRNSSEAVIERTVAAARKSPVRARGALPSEFRSGTESKRSLVDNKRMSLDGKRTFSRSSNSPEFLRRDNAPTRPATAGGARSATVREPRRTGMHSRWASEDTSGEMAESPRPRYERRGGSIESPIALTGRSVVSESFKAAGLTRRRDDDEPPLSAPATRANDTRSSLDWEVQQLREGIARVGVGDRTLDEEDDDDRDDDPRTPPANNRTNARNIHQIVTTSRPGTSNGEYEDGPRTAPPALRTYRSLNTGLITPSGSGTVRDRGATPVTPANLVSAAATEHVRLMLESFAMFESNLARLESNSGAVPELLQNADIVVQTSQNLNAMLRRSAAHAMSQQIEAEVEDRDESELEIWRETGADFRDALKVCDELVRTMTHLLLGVGRVLKDAEGRGGVGSGRVSADGVRSGRVSAEGIRSGRMSAEGLRSGRMSAEGLRSGRMSADGFRARVGENRILEERRQSGSDFRRSLDGETLRRTGSHELPRLRDPARPQTSMSLLREREQLRSPTSDSSGRRLPSESRRLFPRAESPAPANEADTSYDTDVYPSPSPAARQLSEHRHERVLSIPPRLETVPSESIVPRATISRRPRINVSTIRGGTPFTTPSPAPASTQINTTTGSSNSSPEKPQRSMSYSVSRTAGAAMSRASIGLSSSLARKRTISTADPLEPEEEPVGRSTITRGRPSMDFDTSADESSASGTERRPRRRMATELFT